MNSWAVRGWILFAALLAIVYAGWISIRVSGRSQAEAELRTFAVAGSPTTQHDDHVDDFELTDQSGHEFGSAQLKGKVWIASFFFASCPATCRQLNLALAGVQEATPADVMLVSLTCDPDNDTPEQLARYAEVFHANPDRWKFLSGKMSNLQRVGRDIFQVAFEKQVHSERAFVVDRDGRVRARYSVLDRAQADNMIKFVRELDQQTAPAAAAADSETPAETPSAETAQAAAAPDSAVPDSAAPTSAVPDSTPAAKP